MHNKPLPIGYVEYQRAWVDLSSPGYLMSLEEDVRRQAHREHPGFVQTSSRCERTVDGAGVWHFCLYMGFAPAKISSEPLDPRNLNKAENANQIGDPGRDLAIGSKEQKF